MPPTKETSAPRQTRPIAVQQSREHRKGCSRNQIDPIAGGPWLIMDGAVADNDGRQWIPVKCNDPFCNGEALIARDDVRTLMLEALETLG